MRRTYTKLSRAISLAGALLMLVGFTGCSGFQGKKGSRASAESICPNNPAGGINVISGTRTVSLVYGRVTLDNYISCTGLGQASLRTEDEWAARQGTFSDDGYASQISGPMMMALASLAGEVCQDIIEKEAPLAPPQRAIFTNWDLSANAGAQPGTAVDDSMNRLAIGCWQRNVAPDERAAITAVVDQIASSSANVAGRAQAITLCTSMLGSLSAIEL